MAHLDPNTPPGPTDILEASAARAPTPIDWSQSVIVCSCAVVSDRDIELAVYDIMSSGPGMLPTPGVVFRHLRKKMNCCSCASITVSAIYVAMDRLARDTRLCPFALAEARAKLIRIEERRERRQRRIDATFLAAKTGGCRTSRKRLA